MVAADFWATHWSAERAAYVATPAAYAAAFGGRRIAVRFG
jgi:hypothetical protein